MLQFLDINPTFLCRKHSYTLVAPINLDRADFVALDAFIIGDSEPFIGKVILSSFFPTPFLASLLILISLYSGRILQLCFNLHLILIFVLFIFSRPFSLLWFCCKAHEGLINHVSHIDGLRAFLEEP